MCGVLVVGAAVVAELQALRDNSFLTHLATGRLILADGAVPTSDPYTFSAAGAPWVVQSWLASVLYASVEALGGIEAVRLLAGASAGIVAALGWRLLRPVDGLVVRLALGVLFVMVGAALWAERPLMLGLTAFALTVLAAEGGLDPRWLVPVGWIWVNSHGSFPLGLVYLAVAGLGSRLDARDWRVERRSLGWAVLGVALGAASPLGPRILLFPLELLQRQDLLSNVLEWQAPDFDSTSQRAFLVQLAVAVVLIARRPSYRSALVTAVFVAAALLGSRNITVASIALLPSMASAVGGLGTLAASQRPRRGLVMLGGALAACTLLVAGRLESQPPLRLSAYPVDVLVYLEEADVDLNQHRLAGPERVGNLLTYVYGPGERVFYDDRFDMFPDDVSRAQLAVTNATPGVFEQLDAFDVELLTVRRTHSMALVLAKDQDWRILFTDEHWLLACRRGVALDGTLGRC